MTWAQAKKAFPKLTDADKEKVLGSDARTSFDRSIEQEKLRQAGLNTRLDAEAESRAAAGDAWKRLQHSSSITLPPAAVWALGA